jgi:transcriptional regulator GlxA family with amidase domain
MQPKTIAIVAFNQISPFQLSVPCAVFGENRRDIQEPRFVLRVCALEEGELNTGTGFAIRTDCGLGGLEDADMVIVPSWRDPGEIPPEGLLDALRRAYERGAVVVGLCMGAFVLAAAGLLAGRPATTHWMVADELARRYPETVVRADVLYVDDGRIVTSAGVAAGIDCCLHLVRRFYGAEAASRVARRMVVPPHRQGGQAQYIEVPLTSGGAEEGFARNLDWLQRNLHRPHSLDSLAQRFMMSRRTFTRRFRQVTGTTVGAWLAGQRLALAQRLLETTTKPIDLIAQEAGFGSEGSLRLHFSRELKTSPSRYRQEFRGEVSSPSA